MFSKIISSKKKKKKGNNPTYKTLPGNFHTPNHFTSFSSFEEEEAMREKPWKGHE
jgi:hypothetical protein